jgi:hypothetical protein
MLFALGVANHKHAPLSSGAAITPAFVPRNRSAAGAKKAFTIGLAVEKSPDERGDHPEPVG